MVIVGWWEVLLLVRFVGLIVPSAGCVLRWSGVLLVLRRRGLVVGFPARAHVGDPAGAHEGLHASATATTGRDASVKGGLLVTGHDVFDGGSG